MPEVGIVIPAHASALGKAILAFDDEAASRLLSTSPLRSMTGETITASVDLKEQLADISSTGIAQEQEEAVLGECSLARPVFDSSGAPVGAIGLVVPSTSWSVEPTTRDAVRDAARAISRELGATTWPPNRTEASACLSRLEAQRHGGVAVAALRLIHEGNGIWPRTTLGTVQRL